MKKLFILLCLLSYQCAQSQISITIKADSANRPISPYLYAKNGAIGDMQNADQDLLQSTEAGIRLTRQNSGNNATNYNWRKKLTCHPDWYNNVYSTDWVTVAQKLAHSTPEMQGMFAFQLIGRVASTKAYNFDEWSFNEAKWWEGCSKNLCGGGTFTQQGGTYTFTDGDYTLYTQEWTADSTANILSHWKNTLTLDLSQFKYWNMDNEAEIWAGTHDDIIKERSTAGLERYLDNYFATVKAARKLYPGIKICGPVAASEWTWYNPASDSSLVYGDKYYSWLEYFIMRCAQEEKASGVKMIDVIDLHNYPEDTSAADILQTHRMLWDTTFNYPKANGVKKIHGYWDASITKECVFARCQDWIDEYFGAGYEVSYGISEYNVRDVAQNNARVTALAYASNLGEGARSGMEYFIPWGWKYGMWETVHLFGRYAKEINVAATSTNEAMVSAYTSVNSDRSAMTIILVNRNASGSKSVSISVSDFAIPDSTYSVLQLSNLPDDAETFTSHSSNALKQLSIPFANGKTTIQLPAYSITAILLSKSEKQLAVAESDLSIKVFPNPAHDVINVSGNAVLETVELYSTTGILCRKVDAQGRIDCQLPTAGLPAGMYILHVKTKSETKTVSIYVE